MDNFVLMAILALVLGAAGRYIYKAKKSGRACIGCPEGNCSGGCSCCRNNE